RKAFLAEIVDARAEPPQRVHQIADRALVHARRSREPVLAPGKREDCGKRPEGRAGVAEAKVGGLVRERPAAHRGRIALDADAQKLEGVQHRAGVVGIQQILDARLALRQRGEQEHAVGDALRSGHFHRALGPRDRIEIEEFHVSFSQHSRTPRAPAVFFPSLDKEGWRAQRDGVVDHPSRGDSTPPPPAAPLLERGGENPGAALIAHPSASARARRAPRRSFSPPWTRRGGARSATGWSTILLAAT